MDTKQKNVIIVAGGSGKRMGNDIPKQFIEINKLPILMHTINCFYNYDPNIKIIVVLPESQHGYWKSLISKYNYTLSHTIAKGGTERFHSVLNGLKHVDTDCLVAVHDGVRPLVSFKTIDNCFKKAQAKGTAVPVIPAMESIRKVTVDSNIALNRSQYFMVQTPEVFQAEILVKAYKQAFDSTFTDDASVVEKAGFDIELVEGNPENIKITQPMDLKIAQALLSI